MESVYKSIRQMKSNLNRYETKYCFLVNNKEALRKVTVAIKSIIDELKVSLLDHHLTDKCDDNTIELYFSSRLRKGVSFYTRDDDKTVWIGWELEFTGNNVYCNQFSLIDDTNNLREISDHYVYSDLYNHLDKKLVSLNDTKTIKAFEYGIDKELINIERSEFDYNREEAILAFPPLISEKIYSKINESILPAYYILGAFNALQSYDFKEYPIALKSVSKIK